ncbi:NAD(P)H dehydrogenase [Trinickia dabaoshanensis]|uniref:FMN dependent NADH:quinone oxidoreductase n=1 Tax=Trinickia dabaoshanensis TaxID=564714 RepID=A0A2N7VCR8_9BURK|nr:NAD(P)H-dependent oxidoreductase [Trinickia dabaoshanensis]PMS14963.1 NAD(P)H dehydrogenase [Trinickia dabaoshanensis]
MTRILHLDSSARAGVSGVCPHGSHTRRLSARFVARWRESMPGAIVTRRDIGAAPPSPVTGEWIHAAFTRPAERDGSMRAVLAPSDALVDELLAADIVVAGVPMYNFGPPAQFKAYIDNVVRVGRTFGFDRNRPGDPYWPLLAGQDKRLVLLSSRGDYGYDAPRLAERNHVEASIATAFAYIGIDEVHCIAIEYDEFGDARLAQSIEAAERDVDALVDRLIARIGSTTIDA